jgi:hypothetical protein
VLLRAAGFSKIKIANAPVIHNPGRLRTLAKLSAHFAADLIYVCSGRKWVLGYSMFAVARIE